ncbi:hypothetical protein [Nonomuraea africana]|uniref:Uncharacterized protein n=1 Tax=Nonomuraea africana TaxID=46171 RepID=A0ABR9KJS3_9ACTN|nr:hypothetical protein [Nonomuraea africana]MBE1562265.1 hypothetical protein [Nonomuraea africana]
MARTSRWKVGAVVLAGVALVMTGSAPSFAGSDPTALELRVVVDDCPDEVTP